MRRIDADVEELHRFGSHGVRMHQPTETHVRLFETSGPASLVLAHLIAGGVLGRHPAVGPQLLAVASGRVRVSGGDGASDDLDAGECVLFEDGEEHETVAIADSVLAILQWGG